MTPTVAALLVVAAVAGVLDWVAVAAGGPRSRQLERIAKPLVPVALIAAALAWPAGPGFAAAAVRGCLVGALAASLAGDVLLLPPGRFVPGLVAFLAAHLAYLAGFVIGGGLVVGWLLAGLVVAGVVLATAGRVLLRAAEGSGLRGPVAAYMVAILVMAVGATGTGEPAAIAGGWLFVASDTMLGWDRLRGGRGVAGSATGTDAATGVATARSANRSLGVVVMVTYHLAQGLLLLALAA